MKNIMVVEDNLLVRDYLVRSVSDQADLQVVAAIGNVSEAVFHCQKHRIDLVLMDIHTREHSTGLDAARLLKRDCPGVKIVLMTNLPTVGLIEEAKDIGIEGFVYKDTPPNQLIKTLRRSLRGKSDYPF